MPSLRCMVGLGLTCLFDPGLTCLVGSGLTCLVGSRLTCLVGLCMTCLFDPGLTCLVGSGLTCLFNLGLTCLVGPTALIIQWTKMVEVFLHREEVQFPDHPPSPFPIWNIEQTKGKLNVKSIFYPSKFTCMIPSFFVLALWNLMPRKGSCSVWPLFIFLRHVDKNHGEVTVYRYAGRYTKHHAWRNQHQKAPISAWIRPI